MRSATGNCLPEVRSRTTSHNGAILERVKKRGSASTTGPNTDRACPHDEEVKQVQEENVLEEVFPLKQPYHICDGLRSILRDDLLGWILRCHTNLG